MHVPRGGSCSRQTFAANWCLQVPASKRKASQCTWRDECREILLAFGQEWDVNLRGACDRRNRARWRTLPTWRGVHACQNLRSKQLFVTHIRYIVYNSRKSPDQQQITRLHHFWRYQAPPASALSSITSSRMQVALGSARGLRGSGRPLPTYGMRRLSGRRSALPVCFQPNAEEPKVRDAERGRRWPFSCASQPPALPAAPALAWSGYERGITQCSALVAGGLQGHQGASGRGHPRQWCWQGRSAACAARRHGTRCRRPCRRRRRQGWQR